MALTADRISQHRTGTRYAFPCAASKTFYKGAGIVLDSSGNAEPATAATGKKTVGVSLEQKTSSSVAGAETIAVEAGEWLFKNSGTDALTNAQVGSVCYWEDDETVAKTSGTNSVAGYVKEVTTEGVWVAVHSPAAANPSGAALVANNLSDVVAATARSNIGANKLALTLKVNSLAGSGAEVARVVCPVAGTIEKIWSVITGALAVGDATLTGKIGANAITNGAITIAQSGSAAGDIDSATPTAANTVTAGQVISLTVGGTNTATESAICTIDIEY
jgi:hypothetical protein